MFPFILKQQQDTFENDDEEQDPNVVPRAESLCMDHVRLTFCQYLWGSIFVSPNATFVAIRGLVWFLIRRFWTRLRTGKPTIPLPKQFASKSGLVAKMCLEMMLAIHYTERINNNTVACFDFDSIPLVIPASFNPTQEEQEQDSDSASSSSSKRRNDELQFVVFDSMHIEIDLTKREMTLSTLRSSNSDDLVLTADQTMTILIFYAITVNHVQIHAMSNWGINPQYAPTQEQQQQHEHPWQSHIATVMYNHFGFSLFPSSIPFFIRCGLLPPGWTPELFRRVICHALQRGIPEHSMIGELAPHSFLVRLVIRLRRDFLNLFDKYKDDMPPHVHAEAMFVGTVVHALDHIIGTENTVKDSLMYNVQDPMCGAMASVVAVVRAGFMEELPSIMFRRFFYEIQHPFYQSVYEKAYLLNPKLADALETGIIR